MDEWDPDETLEERRHARAEARGQRARAVRRQRILALATAGLAICAVAVGAVVVGDTHAHRSGRPHQLTRAHHRPHDHHPGAHAPRLPPPPAEVRGQAARRMRIPILMYHVIGTRPAAAPYPDLWVTPAAFRAQMIALRDGGYRGVSLRRAFDGLQHGGPLPRKPVVVSFDDGYRGDYVAARPVLRRLGWPGVLNLEVRNVRPGDLTAAEVRGLIASGWEVDSHTISHPDLTSVDAARLRAEVVDSRRALRRRFGVAADFFCYPSGRYDSRVVTAVRSAGYLGATTTVEGEATSASPFTMPRVRVGPGDSPRRLLSRIR
jgi:peptidoglycan/xylan/chitin deacetylase (PgdA/CDA1 family)